MPIFIRLMQITSIEKLISFKQNSINLDVGCGDAWLSKKISYLLPKNSILYSVDWHKAEYIHVEESNFIKSDVNKLPFNDSSIDFILLSSVLQVVPDDDKLLIELDRVLDNNGTIVMTVPNGYPLIKKILENGLCNKILAQIKKTNISYMIFKQDTNKLYNISGKGFYNLNQISTLLHKNGFQIVEVIKSPGLIGSFLFQILLLIRYIFGLKKLTSKFDFFLTPLIFIDRFITFNSISIELVIKVKKIA